MIQPESLGPCEPGTAVKVSGIVFQETDKGLLMLNVNWKGKTYMGTLLNCHFPLEEHKWGPPGELPVALRGGKRGRCTRSRTPPVQKSSKDQEIINKTYARTKKLLISLPGSPLAKDSEHGSKKHPLLELQNCLMTNPSSLKLESSSSVEADEDSGRVSIVLKF